MQHSEGLDLRRNWGEKPCEHKKLDAELFETTPTGDYLCRQCGKVFEAWEIDKMKDHAADDD